MGWCWGNGQARIRGRVGPQAVQTNTGAMVKPLFCEGEKRFFISSFSRGGIKLINKVPLPFPLSLLYETVSLYLGCAVLRKHIKVKVCFFANLCRESQQSSSFKAVAGKVAGWEVHREDCLETFSGKVWMQAVGREQETSCKQCQLLLEKKLKVMKTQPGLCLSRNMSRLLDKACLFVCGRTCP